MVDTVLAMVKSKWLSKEVGTVCEEGENVEERDNKGETETKTSATRVMPSNVGVTTLLMPKILIFLWFGPFGSMLY